MGQRSVTFIEMINRLRLIGVHIDFTSCPGWVYLFGKKGGPMPWTRGPLYPVKLRAANEPIPAKMVQKIMKHLGLEHDDREQFWNATTHVEPTA